MHDLAESLGRTPTHPLRGRIGRCMLGILELQRLQRLEQAVVLGIRDGRCVKHVVRMVVRLKRFSQGPDTGGNRRINHERLIEDAQRGGRACIQPRAG